MPDGYAGIADRYDLFARPDEAARPFYRRLFDQHQVRRVLDCACGTGLDLVLFHELDREIVGSDLSPAMLAQARRNLEERGIKADLRELDYRELLGKFDPDFDAVVCLSTSIAHMPTEQEAVRALRSMRDVLRDGGILVLSQGTTDKQWQEKPRFILATDTPEASRVFVIDYHGRGATYNVIDILHGSGEIKAWSTDYPLMLLRDDQEKLLREAGFQQVEFFSGYNFEPYDKNGNGRLITVATT